MANPSRSGGGGGFGKFFGTTISDFQEKNLRKKLYVNLFDQGKDNRFFFSYA